MKKILMSTACGIFFLFCITTRSTAQDWKKVNPNINKILTDTAYVRAMEVTLEPGQKSDMHTHPAHFFYALTEGKLTVHYADGKTEEYDLKPGDSGFSSPERPHITENTGDKTVKFLLVELKEHPYKAPAKVVSNKK
jgi:quercetin dioxygenase-like cupin family protein